MFLGISSLEGHSELFPKQKDLDLEEQIWIDAIVMAEIYLQHNILWLYINSGYKSRLRKKREARKSLTAFITPKKRFDICDTKVHFTHHFPMSILLLSSSITCHKHNCCIVFGMWKNIMPPPRLCQPGQVMGPGPTQCATCCCQHNHLVLLLTAAGKLQALSGTSSCFDTSEHLPASNTKGISLQYIFYFWYVIVKVYFKSHNLTQVFFFLLYRHTAIKETAWFFRPLLFLAPRYIFNRKVCFFCLFSSIWNDA